MFQNPWVSRMWMSTSSPIPGKFSTVMSLINISILFFWNSYNGNIPCLTAYRKSYRLTSFFFILCSLYPLWLLNYTSLVFRFRFFLLLDLASVKLSMVLLTALIELFSYKFSGELYFRSSGLNFLFLLLILYSLVSHWISSWSVFLISFQVICQFPVSIVVQSPRCDWCQQLQ